MSEPLEELCAQRALIKQHLDWLDRQIETAERAASSTEPTNTAASSPDLSTASTEKQSAPAIEAGTTPEAPSYEINEDQILAPGTSDLMRAKIGCLAMFAFATLLFLFLLFGLPYLID